MTDAMRALLDAGFKQADISRDNGDGLIATVGNVVVTVFRKHRDPDYAFWLIVQRPGDLGTPEPVVDAQHLTLRVADAITGRDRTGVAA